MDKYHIAIDLGATSGRVVVGNLENLEVVYRFSTAYEVVLGTMYWDILRIFSEIKTGLGLAFSQYGNAIASIGIDGWGVDYALLDAEGCLVSPVYHYRDKRTEGIVDIVGSLVGNAYLFKTTGLAFQQYNTIYQLFAMKRERKEVLAAARQYLSLPDLLAYFLTGRMENERTQASTTGLYDCTRGTWSGDLLRQLQLPEKIFGTIVSSGTVIGPLEKALCQEVGAPNDVIVVASATHDTAAAVSWITEEAYISSGTWSLIGMNLEKPVLSVEAMESGFTNETGAEGKITFVKNIMGLWISNECVRGWKEAGEMVEWSELDKQTRECLGYPGFIDPTNSVFMAPDTKASPMDRRVATYLQEKGYPRLERRGECLIAIYRGLAKTYAASLRIMERITGKQISRIRIVGGGAKNSILNQLTATETEKNIIVGPVEATSLGNIFNQMKALHYISSIQEGANKLNKCL